MKKIGLFTINDNNNYGNRLQNYATQVYLKSLGFEVETIKNQTTYSKYSKRPSFYTRTRNMISLSPISIYKRIVNIIQEKFVRCTMDDLLRLRSDNFSEFNDKYILESDYFISDCNIPDNLGNMYDYYITGSDQIWNPNYPRTSEIDFLLFAPKNKRVAFSASFGVAEITASHLERFKIWLSEMNFLSVREDEGAKIIKDLTGRDVPVCLDPTMLLNREDWLSIAKSPVDIEEGEYLLTYFLGDKSKQFLKQINCIALSRKLNIINLCDINNKDAYVAGPSEFIWYIANCSVLCTDSFHGAVFAILFGKPFVIYQRKGVASMYSRINTLLKKFNFMDRKAENLKSIDDVFKIDNSKTCKILEEERLKIFKYLGNALCVKDELK